MKDTATDPNKKKAASHARLSKPLFITNLKIDNVQRNYLKVISDLGFASSQKGSLQFLIDKYLGNLNQKQKDKIKRLVNDYNRFDHLKWKNKK